MDYDHVVGRIGEVIDAAGVVVLVAGALCAAGAAAVRIGRHETGTYRRFREQLGQAILLGLELLVAGDIVRTVAAEPTLTSVAVLAIIVLIRTFLSFSLDVELTGRWPWQQNLWDQDAQATAENTARSAKPIAGPPSGPLGR
jgi:uncharacterized membrane protein